MTWQTTPRAERVAQLREWAAEGVTSSVMAERFGTTRNAVIGLCHRAEIVFMRSPKLRPINTPTVPAPPKMVLPCAPDDPPLPHSTPTDLLHTTGCRWPVEGGFCNDPLHRKLYCETHAARAYQPSAAGLNATSILAKLPFKTSNPNIKKLMRGHVSSGLVRYKSLAKGEHRYYMTENAPGY